MSQVKRAPDRARIRCSDCKNMFTPTPTPDVQGDTDNAATAGGDAARCGLCAGQLVLPFPRLRDARGRFLPVVGGGR
ncbi:hypothetical protein EDC02_3464 [Micromonospora sp. Llam0]|uniref:hypothetical protein n=1 Tax=Micromonospora sp. Llam0 TaxID=2485143 RepID=UPI000FBA05A0|nr:hypothetical protein [Micromonospora sp. Llam0]ROO52490.1 hypothetical protein EDC02_7419 [Micromonospora sp. Llam0]ROO61526.1 hypothetical protein EDC02_3464 [Micromonospora sp. Llam0]